MKPTAFAATEIDLNEVFDLDRYPIHAIGDAARTELVNEAREAMLDTGCFRVRDFVRPEAIEAMAAEATSLHDQTFWSVQDHNPYFSPDDESFPEDHPRRTFQHRQSGFINSDILTEQSLLRKIYDADVLVHFVWECLGTPQPIYRWADPLGRNPYGVMEPTHYLPWHFDGNEFTVSILVQKADEGGVFEYVPNIRTPEAENYEHIKHILDGGRDGVHELDLQPGDLQLFRGRYSLHRVAPLKGIRPRYVAIFSYVEEPGMVGSVERTRQLYGRTLPIHHERSGQRADPLVD